MIANRFYPLGVNYRPYDAEVKYIYTNPIGPYIDTGVSARLLPKLELAAAIWKGNQILFGARSVDGLDGYQLYTEVAGNISVRFCEVRIQTDVRWGGENNYTTVVMDPSEKNAIINGKTFAINYSGEHQFIDAPIWLCGRNPDGFYASARIYYCKMTLPDGTIIRDFIPVRVGDVGYMFDRVSGKLFGNQGTGAFGLGADK